MNGIMTKVKGALSAAKEGVNARTITACAGASTALVGLAAVPFASSGGSASLPTLTITQDMLKPLVDGVISNVGVILPIGLGLFAIFLGIRIIPRLITSFVRM